MTTYLSDSDTELENRYNDNSRILELPPDESSEDEEYEEYLSSILKKQTFKNDIESFNFQKETKEKKNKDKVQNNKNFTVFDLKLNNVTNDNNNWKQKKLRRKFNPKKPPLSIFRLKTKNTTKFKLKNDEFPTL